MKVNKMQTVKFKSKKEVIIWYSFVLSNTALLLVAMLVTGV